MNFQIGAIRKFSMKIQFNSQSKLELSTSVDQQGELPWVMFQFIIMKNLIFCFFISNLMFVYCESNVDFKSSVYTLPLGSESKFHWRVEPVEELIEVEVHYTADELSWFAVGFSDRGDTRNADYCVLWFDWKHAIHFDDAWVDELGIIQTDLHQDCNKFNWNKCTDQNVTKFTFTRKFDTCDRQDYVIQRGTNHIIWSKGRGPLLTLNGVNINDASISGLSRTQLLRPVSQSPKFPNDIWKFSVHADQVQVPDDETTYWCKVQRLPESLKRKHHILQFGPIIQPGNEHLVHHMEVFHCSTSADITIPSYNGPCDSSNRPPVTQVCKKVLAAWAMGADNFLYPEEAGLSIGGESFNQFVLLEVHYNNPERIKGTTDSSGLEFHVTTTLRKYDAGIMELGLEYVDKMAIPPGQMHFELSGHCVSHCTGTALPQSGIFVFASQLHAHLTGTKIRTRHIRNGKEISPLNYDDHYSSHFQEIRLLPKPVQIIPGDSLITTCTYNTMNRSNVTLGGFAISDEMCVNYIHYYPSTQLEVCKSSISDDALRSYFRFMRDWEGQETDFDDGISMSYNNIEWNELRVAALHDLYETSPLGMQCNGSDGARLPGLWDNTPVIQVELPLSPPARNCPNFHGSHNRSDNDFSI